jgi:Uma2 family endonuclease
MSAVKTLTRLSPADHGRPMSNAELAVCRGQSGYKFEVIDGRLYVSYEPDLSEDRVEEWLCSRTKSYANARPEIINYVTRKARVFIPGRPGDTVPEPDLAAYQDFPLEQRFDGLEWADVSPLLVAEILSRHDPHKDLVRNVSLYMHVPSIREYWILDTRDDAERPSMTVYRRGRGKWQRPLELAGGQTYTTKLLPGFELILNARS